MKIQNIMKYIKMFLALIAFLLLEVRAAGNCLVMIDSDVVNTPTTWTFTFNPGNA